jgi:hypothetical protein
MILKAINQKNKTINISKVARYDLFLSIYHLFLHYN